MSGDLDGMRDAPASAPGVGGAPYGGGMPEWSEVLDAVGVAVGGDRDEGRRRLVGCWESTGPQDAAQRCVLAHYLADLEPQLSDEVAWDERALAAFDGVGPGDLAPVGIADAAAMEPSLRLNLADGYRRQGRAAEARGHLEAGMAAAPSLPDDGYGSMVRGGLERLRRRLDGGPDGDG